MTVYHFAIIAIVYMVVITFVFTFKKVQENAENIIFSHLILIGLATGILDIVCIYLLNNNPDGEIYNFFYKIYHIFVAYYVLVFTEYVVAIVQPDIAGEEKIIKQNKLCNGVMIFMIFWSIFIVYIDQGGILPTTLVSDVTIRLSVLCFIFWIVLLVVKRKKVINAKLIPIIIVIICGVSSAVVQKMEPTLRLIAPALIFTTVTLYFTIFPLENPDVKTIQEMEQAKKEADQANQSKTEYLSNVSHEIRTPLNAILGFSQGMLESDLSENVRDEVEDIVDASEILLEIVNEILDISKIESKKLEIVNVDYSTEKLFKSLTAMAETRVGSRQIQFIHNYNHDIPPVLLGDYVRIKQIVVNLLTNAIKYTKEGFIKLTFDCEKQDDNICRLIISVTDSGIGIKPENIDKIFSKFEGLELNQDIEIEGTGLGLSLTKRLVDMMGGKIVVQSKFGEGSTFTVLLNQKVSEKTYEQLEAEMPKPIASSFVGNGQKILIVDDNAVNLKVALRLMREYNLNIETLTRGKECIAKIVAGNKYDLVMLDDMMPEMSGVETLNYLKENTSYNIPTIALTANAISGMKEKYLELGFDDYLSKPIDKPVLEELLIKYLGNSTSTSSNTTEVSTQEKTEVVETKVEEVNPEPIEEPQVEQVQETQPEIVVQQPQPEAAAQQSEPVVEQAPVQETEDVAFTGDTHSEDFLRANGVDLEKAMEFLGDMEMYDETVNDFLAEIDEKLANIEKFKTEQDMPNYAILVHSLKSDSKYIGLMDLADLAYKHEMASKGNDVEFVNSNYDELMTLAKKRVDMIKKYNGQ